VLTLLTIAVLTIVGRAASANSPAATPATQTSAVPSPTSGERSARDIEEQVRAAEQWALFGVLIPAGAGAAFSIITEPGGKMSVPTWQLATLGSLFGFSGLWGVSMGYYRGGRPLYATLTGVSKTALLVTAIAVERSMDCDKCDTPPVVGIAAIAAIVAWDIWEYLRLESSVRERARDIGHASVAPYLTAGSNRFVLGLATRF
jgi:hypothetical protein